jgi:hypothetical protein
VKGKAEADITQGTGASTVFEVYGKAPSISFTQPLKGIEITTDNDKESITVNATITDTTSITEVWASIDGGSMVKQTITPGTSVKVSVKADFDSSTDGKNHTVLLKATNSMNVSMESSTYFIVKKNEASNMNMIMIAILLVIIIVIALVVVVMMMKKKGSKPAETPKTEEPVPEKKEDSPPST